MPAAPLPADENARVTALHATGVLDSAAEESFDDLARVASEICDAPVALISLVDTDRQWFKSRVGVDIRETCRDDSICAHALTESVPLVIHDAAADPRFVDYACVIGQPRYRFYAGVPLRLDPNGSAVGTLCVLDYEPRTLSPAQLAALSALGRQIARELRLRRDVRLGREDASLKRERLLSPGDVVPGGWTIVRQLGEGGVGAVFEARRGSDERAAIKLLLPVWRDNAAVVARFVREARLLARVTSPHVARLFDVENLTPDHGGLPYLVMEYLEGMDLGRRIAQHGPVPWPDAVRWVADACDGLAALHDLGAVHRDLKPSNVFLVADGTVKLLDFGVATADVADASPLTRPDTRVGTMPYMAPEQFLSSAKANALVDVWSLGVTLYETLTARMPFDGTTAMEVCASILTKPPLPLPQGKPDAFPPELRALVRACLERAPASRPASARELSARLHAIAASRPRGVGGR